MDIQVSAHSAKRKIAENSPNAPEFLQLYNELKEKKWVLSCVGFRTYLFIG